MLQLDKTEDPRTPIERLRRAELKTILINYGENPGDLPAEVMRQIIQSKGIDINAPRRMPAAREVTNPTDVNSMSRHDLMRLARARGMAVKRTDTLISLRDKLNG